MVMLKMFKELTNNSSVPQQSNIAGGNLLAQKSMYWYNGKTFLSAYPLAFPVRVFRRVALT